MKIGKMEAPLDDQFIREINQNLGIAHKVCNVYFFASEEREDVLQEMMYQLWRSYPGFQQHAKFSTWMYRVCLNTALTYLRKNKRKRSETIASEHYQIPDHGKRGTDENIEMLYEAISLLSPINKAIILLYLEDMSYEEIADVTSLSKSNVSVRLVRIKKELENYFRKQSKELENEKHG
jgi:RNA polymerase sigma factor (sigma-70 family)